MCVAAHAVKIWKSLMDSSFFLSCVRNEKISREKSNSLIQQIFFVFIISALVIVRRTEFLCLDLCERLALNVLLQDHKGEMAINSDECVRLWPGEIFFSRTLDPSSTIVCAVLLCDRSQKIHQYLVDLRVRSTWRQHVHSCVVGTQWPTTSWIRSMTDQNEPTVEWKRSKEEASWGKIESDHRTFSFYLSLSTAVAQQASSFSSLSNTPPSTWITHCCYLFSLSILHYFIAWQQKSSKIGFHFHRQFQVFPPLGNNNQKWLERGEASWKKAKKERKIERKKKSFHWAASVSSSLPTLALFLDDH